MNTLLLIVTLASTLVSGFVSCFYAWLSYKKSQEMDEAWDAAVRIVGRLDNFTQTADDFADLYVALKYVREHPDADYSGNTIRSLIREGSESEAQPRKEQ